MAPTPMVGCADLSMDGGGKVHRKRRTLSGDSGSGRTSPPCQHPRWLLGGNSSGGGAWLPRWWWEGIALYMKANASVHWAIRAEEGLRAGSNAVRIVEDKRLERETCR